MNFKTKPFAHQAKALELSKDKTVFALLMEQGTGKTKVAIDNVAYLYFRGEIDALLVVAPNGVHRNWVDDELPAHMWDSVPYQAMIFRSGKANSAKFKRDFDDLITFDGLAVLAINVDALITANGKEAVKRFLTRKVFMAVDESTDIKSPSAKRTKAARTFGRLARFRRILTGTPTGDGSPLDLYSQFAFLDPDIIGLRSFTAFKHEHAILETRIIPGQTRRTFQQVVGYKNLDRLNAVISPHSFRVTKDDALPDLPPKIFTKRYIELSTEQARLYRELRSNFLVELQDGSVVTAAMAMTRIMRLQQIACGHIGTGPGEPSKRIPGPNPRLDTLVEVLEQYPGKTIVWCRFTDDINLIMETFPDVSVRYDGNTSEEERSESKIEFQRGTARLLVGNPKAGGRGLTLHAAQNVVFFSNYFGLETRQQAEDRAHRIGLQHRVNYIDLIAEGTVDEKIVRALRAKQNIANLITGDTAREWI
jgi:SNF2 family DNA or RNA helicase